MKRVITLFASLLIAFYTLPSYSDNVPGSKNGPGVVIKDKQPYPLSRYSELIQHDGSPSLLLKGDESDDYLIVSKMLDNMGAPYQVVSESPAIFQTGWISWHYHAKSKEAMSAFSNRVFTLNRRDKYKFRIAIIKTQQHPVLTLDKIKREREVDITPDTEMVWLKWVKKEPDNNAVSAFLQRLQTEYELRMLISNAPAPKASVVPVAQVASTNKVADPSSNYMALDMSVDQAWGVLIKQLTQKSVILANTHNNQHMLNTDWVYAEYDTKTSKLNTSKKDSQRHKFQVLVIPGSASNKSSIFVYHTSFQQNSGANKWSDENTQEAIAGAFLNFLDIDQ
jgi:hypothetical protein